MRQNIPRFLTMRVYEREESGLFFWRTIIWDSNRKIILMDTGSRQKDLVPCSWLQKSTCYLYILSFTAQNNLTVPVHGRETQKERQPPGTSGHNGGLAALQASALVAGSRQHHLGNQGGHWMRPEDGRGLDLLSCWEAKRGLEICPVCLKGTLF